MKSQGRNCKENVICAMVFLRFVFFCDFFSLEKVARKEEPAKYNGKHSVSRAPRLKFFRRNLFLKEKVAGLLILPLFYLQKQRPVPLHEFAQG